MIINGSTTEKVKNGIASGNINDNNASEAIPPIMVPMMYIYIYIYIYMWQYHCY